MVDPEGHVGQPVATAGSELDRARLALVALHGRGGTAEGILDLASQIAGPEVTCLAPRAADGAWYPRSFLSPLADNEPWLSSALETVGHLLARLDEAGFPGGRVVLMGFSQGACLLLEFAARNPRQYGGLIGLSGGLIGPPGTPRSYPGTCDGTPVLLGCSDRDPHIPKERVDETAAVFERMDARVEERIYAGMGHTVNDDEIARARRMVAALVR